MKRLSKPTLLLWLPIVVWAATFSYFIYLFFAVRDEIYGYHIEQLMGSVPVIVLIINAITFFTALISISVYPQKQKQLLYRLLLLLTNCITAAIFSSSIQLK